MMNYLFLLGFMPIEAGSRLAWLSHMATHHILRSPSYLFVATIILLLVLMVYMEMEFQKSRKMHKQRIQSLQEFIDRLRENQEAQSLNVHLLDQLKEVLQQANRVLSTEILVLVNELIEILTENNLLKK